MVVREALDRQTPGDCDGLKPVAYEAAAYFFKISCIIAIARGSCD